MQRRLIIQFYLITKQSSAIYYNSGFLGVNTANPTIELDVNGRLAVSQGTFANPSITFSPNRNVGFFDDSNILGVSIQGAAKWFFGASHMGSYAAGGALGFTNTATSPALTFSSGTNTGIYFNYKKDNAKQIDSSVTYTGVLAQEVQKQIPEAVKEDQEGFLSLNTTPIFWAMVNAIKEIYYDIKGVKEENALLKVQAAEQARKIQSLEAENAAIKERLDRLEKSR